MIWCVDDDNTIRDIEVYTLTQTGFEAKGFADGVSMLEALKTEKPELIVLDIMLPDSSDLKLLHELLAIKRDARIVIISAINKPEITREALIAGAKGFITKPFNEVEFLCKVRMALED